MADTLRLVLVGMEALLIGMALRVTYVYWCAYRESKHAVPLHVALMAASYCLFAGYALVSHVAFRGDEWTARLLIPVAAVVTGVLGLWIIFQHLEGENDGR